MNAFFSRLRSTLIAIIILIGNANAFLECELICGEEGKGKIRIFFFVDGYAEFMKPTYIENVRSVVDTLFSISPYKEYKSLFTVYRVWTPSILSYTPSSQPSDSTFFGVYYVPGQAAKISQKGKDFFRNIMEDQLDTNFQCDKFRWNQQSVIIFDAPGNNPGVAYKDINLILLKGDGTCLAHELGHAIGNLADEYERGSDFTGKVSEAANVTQIINPESIPWKYWIEPGTPVPTPETDDYYDQIGLFEGANYYSTGWYRPTMNCIMQGSGTSYVLCKVCQEYLTYKIMSYPHAVLKKKNDYEFKFPIPGTKKYDYTSVMVDSLNPSPVNTVLSGGNLYISTIQIEENHKVKIRWFFNGTELQYNGNTLPLSSFNENGSVEAILEVYSDFIKNPDYTIIDTIKWEYRSPVLTNKKYRVTEAFDKRNWQNGKSVYLVPKSSFKNFYVNDMLGRNVPVKISDAGKDYTRIELKNMASGRFFIKSAE